MYLESSIFKRVPAISAADMKEKPNRENEEDSESSEDNPEDDFEIKISNNPKKGKKKSKKRKNKEQDWVEKETTGEEGYGMKEKKNETKGMKGKVKSTASKDEEKQQESDEESNDKSEQPPNSHESFKTSHQKSKSVIVDPNKIFQMEASNPKEGLTDDPENSGHILNIQEAFSNDDVIEEFVREKEETIESSKGKDLDLMLPGWGDWGGPGVKVNSKKRKKFIKKAEEPPPRKDRNLAHVIINEEGNKRLAKLQVTSTGIPSSHCDDCLEYSLNCAPTRSLAADHVEFYQ